MTRKQLSGAPGVVSVKEAAEYLGIHEITLRRWIYAGRMPAHKVGPHLVRINVDDLIRVASGEVAAS